MVAEKISPTQIDQDDDPSERFQTITDMSLYARCLGIGYKVYFSPQVLIDVVDVPSELEFEDDLQRVIRVLSKLDINISKSYNKDELFFGLLMTLGTKDKRGVPDDYELVAHLHDHAVIVVHPNEHTIDDSPAMRERIECIKASLTPPKSPFGRISPTLTF